MFRYTLTSAVATKNTVSVQVSGLKFCLFGSKIGVCLVVPNIQSEVVRTSFSKSLRHKDLWWWRPMTFCAEHPKQWNFRTSKKHCFWRLAGENALSGWRKVMWTDCWCYRFNSTKLQYATTVICGKLVAHNALPSAKKPLFYCSLLFGAKALILQHWLQSREDSKFRCTNLWEQLVMWKDCLLFCCNFTL